MVDKISSDLVKEIKKRLPGLIIWEVWERHGLSLERMPQDVFDENIKPWFEYFKDHKFASIEEGIKEIKYFRLHRKDRKNRETL